MSKKTAGGLLGTIVVAGIAAGVLKYLKDYGGASYTKADEIERVKKNSGEVKDAFKRVYIAVKEKGDVKGEAAGLAKAAGDVMTDAGCIAKTAGTGALEAAKKIKEKYSEDPASAKDEMLNNIKDMGQELYDKAADTVDAAVGSIRSLKEDAEADKSDAAGCCLDDTSSDNAAEDAESDDEETKVTIEDEPDEKEASVEISDEN